MGVFLGKDFKQYRFTFRVAERADPARGHRSAVTVVLDVGDDTGVRAAPEDLGLDLDDLLLPRLGVQTERRRRLLRGVCRWKGGGRVVRTRAWVNT
jgi:hypothetical protein